MPHSSLKAILFDLDGTFLDTAPEFLEVINALLKEAEKTPMLLSELRPYASDGTKGMLKAAFNIENDHPNYEALQNRFLEKYAENLGKKTQLFPGISELLQYMEDRNLQWGIVTNKPEKLTLNLLKNLNLLERCPIIVGGDSLAYRKPHPLPLQHACEKLHIAPHQGIYVGDAERDIQAGKSAGMHTVAALYGYLANKEQGYQWQADYAIDAIEDLYPWIAKRFM